MKFEYDGEEDDRECVAYLDLDGILCIKGHGDSEPLLLSEDGSTYHSWAFTPDRSDVVRKFYHGDKITITF